MNLSKIIRDVPDFPKPGIMFRDITPLFRDPAAFRYALDGLTDLLSEVEFETFAAVESRGFLLAAPLADRLGKRLTILRKPGKLPADTVSESYALEYGEATLEVHRDGLCSDERVVIVDDLLATGGTAAAAARLIRRLDATLIGHLFLVELAFLGGREALGEDPVFSLVIEGVQS